MRPIALLILALVALACARDRRSDTGAAEPAPPSPAAEAPADTPPDDGVPPAYNILAWNAGVFEKRREVRGVATLVAVRTGRHERFDRVVFEFAEAFLPEIHVEYIDRPVRACGSGDVVPLAGDAWLEIRFEPARAHDEEGRTTVVDRERAPRQPNLQELKLTCDFEAQVVWVLGVGSPELFRVFELPDPTRVVVDVRHDLRTRWKLQEMDDSL